MQPADGAVLTTADTFTVTASITDDTRTIGVKWSWLEGLPPTLDSLTRCTNDVCDNNYEFGISFDPGDATWDFVALDNPPPGTYSFQLEVIDAHGNDVTQVATFEVIEEPSGDTGDGDDGAVDETGGDEDDDGGEAEGDGMDDTGEGDDGGDTDDGDDDDGTGDDAAASDPGDGGGCHVGTAPRGTLWLVVFVLMRRRRRSAECSTMV